MKSQAKKNMVKGLIAQLTTNVKMTGLGALTALTTSEKSICTIIGYIIANNKTAMGIFTWAMARELRNSATPGRMAPRAIPITIQRATHIVKYL